MQRRGRNRKRRSIKVIIGIFSILLFFVIVVMGISLIENKVVKIENQKESKNPEKLLKSPEELLKLYYARIADKEYEEMYEMLNEQSRESITKEAFVLRNQNIYEGIEATDIQLVINEITDTDEGTVISYKVTMNTLAGKISFLNQSVFEPCKEGAYPYGLVWHDSMIIPELAATDKVRVSEQVAKRGDILDRNGEILAGMGTASTVGLVPGKMNENYSDDINKLAELLNISAESIEKKLNAKWVKEDSFVPIKTIKKLTELEQMHEYLSEETMGKQELQAALLTIPGIMLTDTEIREYPLGPAASHLTGYLQKVTAEDLEKHQGEGYSKNSMIGRSGIESLYEKELKGENGREIAIVDAEGNKKVILASVLKIDGKDIRLTIDSELQRQLYENYSEDKSCSIAMNPYTGEVLALVSTPSFDSNDFIYGMSEQLWKDLNEDSRNPLYNRFRQKVCPGSSFKPIIAAIGLETGDIDPYEDYGNHGLSWQKDSSWGNYYVTTLHVHEPVTLENAIICSDNIYFAKAALKIGKEKLKEGLNRLGFNSKIPFEISVAESQYSNNGEIESEIQLADSGYGQGQVLVNPIHLAALYTGFANAGNVIKPYLLYKGQIQPEIWIKEAYASEYANQIKAAMEQVVSSPYGTGHSAYFEDIVLAGKTGTAEIKQSKADQNGTELGWFGVFTSNPNSSKPILIMTMAEDVKGRGGSGYVVKKDKQVLDAWFSSSE